MPELMNMGGKLPHNLRRSMFRRKGHGSAPRFRGSRSCIGLRSTGSRRERFNASASSGRCNFYSSAGRMSMMTAFGIGSAARDHQKISDPMQGPALADVEIRGRDWLEGNRRCRISAVDLPHCGMVNAVDLAGIPPAGDCLGCCPTGGVCSTGADAGECLIGSLKTVCS